MAEDNDAIISVVMAMQSKSALFTTITCCFVAVASSACGSDVASVGADGGQRSLSNPNCVYRKADDPELARLAVKARAEWPRFCKAFASRVKDKQVSFVVKGAFTEGEDTEHFWLDVTGIDGKTIKGTHNEDGETIKSVHHGDAASLPVDQIEDWLYDDGEHAAGGYTLAYFAPSVFEPLNGIDTKSPEEGLKAKQLLSNHWQEIQEKAGAADKPELTDADKQTYSFFCKLLRLVTGNLGRRPSANVMADMTGLPLTAVKSIMLLEAIDRQKP